MEDALKVIYVAATVEKAHLLRNALADLGIEAQVTNDALHYAVGELPAGWPTAARVVVHECDAEDARRIALAFDRAGSERALAAEDAEFDSTDEKPTRWPCCPSCGRPRLATCPVCESAGTDFPEAYHPDGEEDVDAEEEGDAEACHGDADNDSAADGSVSAADDSVSAADGDGRLVVICPTCDEPFSPQFPARCEWCGYRFVDGVELQIPAAPAASSEFNLRVAIVLVGLVITMIALFAFFASLLRTG